MYRRHMCRGCSWMRNHEQSTKAQRSTLGRTGTSPLFGYILHVRCNPWDLPRQDQTFSSAFGRGMQGVKCPPGKKNPAKHSPMRVRQSETHIPQRRRTDLTNPGRIGSMGWSDWSGTATGRLLHKSHAHYIQPTSRNSTAKSSLTPRPTHHHKHMHDQHPLLGLGRTVRAPSN
jgi:hypothetical protein